MSAEGSRMFGWHVKRARLARGMSQEQLACLACLTGGAVDRIESGHHNVKLSTAVRLADALGVEVKQLYAGIK